MTQSPSYDSKKNLKIEAYKTIAINPDIDTVQRTKYLFNLIQEFENTALTLPFSMRRKY